MFFRGLCFFLGLGCGHAETPPATAISAPVVQPPMVAVATVHPLPVKPQLMKPTGFPECERTPPRQWQHLYVESSRRYPGVSECDGAKVSWCESGFDTLAVSPVGAKGLPQLMPLTAKELGVSDPFDPHQSIPAMFRYIHWTRSGWSVHERTPEEIKGLGSGSYNWGFGNMLASQKKWGWYSLHEALPHFPEETQGYVPCTLTGERE